MSHAPTSTYFQPHGDGTIQGCFTHKEHDSYFEFSTATPEESAWAGAEYNMKIWLLGGTQWRLAKVLKTVAYVVIGEDEHGRPYVERWPTKKFLAYPRPRA